MAFAALPRTGRVGCQDHNALLGAIRHEGFDFGMEVMPYTRTVMTLFLGMEGKQPECRVAPVIEEQVIRTGTLSYFRLPPEASSQGVLSSSVSFMNDAGNTIWRWLRSW